MIKKKKKRINDTAELNAISQVKDSTKVRNTRRSYKQIILTLSQLTPSSHFLNDLGLDSLDTVYLVRAIE